MVRLLKSLIFIILINSGVLLSQEGISKNEAALLIPFFRSALENTEAGYVLFDKKPVCFEAFSEEICCSELSDWHQTSLALWGAKSVLSRPEFTSGNIIIHVDREDRIFLFINRALFLETVQNNLPLFQYVLGPSITAESLLNEIQSGNKSFFSILNDDKVLIGIVLGYGVQNSLFAARIENIMAARLSADIPPLCPKVSSCVDEFEKKMLLYFPTSQAKEATIEHKSLKPSFGFVSLKQEAEALEARMDISSGNLEEKCPSFIFGYLKKSPDNEVLIDSLENTQKKIQELLASPTFLDDVLGKILANEVNVEKPQQDFRFPLPEINLNIAAAKLLKIGIGSCEKEGIKCFAHGLLEKTEDELNPDEWLLGFPECIHNIRNAKKNLEDSICFFEDLKNQPSFVEILDSQLYYKVIEPGRGSPLSGEAKVCVDMDIFAPSNKCLKTVSEEEYEIWSTIPGFSHGIQGMKKGEKREIYVHPALAYGVHTFLEKGIYLKLVVTLLDFTAFEPTLPKAESTSIEFVRTDEFQNECEKIYRECFACLGTSRGYFIKKTNHFDLAEIAAIIQILEENDSLTSVELDALNRIFWNFYFGA